MRETLLPVYERELRYIRRLAAEFAERYPAVAGRLLLEPDKCEDPHVERLIESFAMLTARVQRRIDDEFPEITDSFLGVLAPHTLAPIPSMTIVQFALDPEQGKTGRGLEIERGALLHTKPVDGVRCRFRTTSALTLWPVRVESAGAVALNEGEPGVPAGARAAIRLRLKSAAGVPFARLALDRLRFFLDGDAAIAHRTYELLFCASVGVVIRGPAVAGGTPVNAFLDATHLEPGGLSPDEESLPVPPQSPRGHLLVEEYFAFPEKFLFAGIRGLSSVLSRFASEEIELLVLLDQFPADLVGKLGPGVFKLGCTPAVNLFPLECEPTTLKHDASEIPVIPDVHAPYSYEVHSILDVSTTSPTSGPRDYRSFYALEHGDPDLNAIAFYHSSRRASLRKDDSGTDVVLALVDRRFDPWEVRGDEVLSVRALCTNRDLPAQLPFGDAQGDFRIEGKPGIASIRCLRKPTPPLRAPQREDARWRLVSLLCLNHLSILGTDGEEPVAGAPSTGRSTPASKSLESFREVLKICDFADSAVTRQRIGGLVGIRARRVLRRVQAAGWLAPARGIEVELTFDEDRYAGSSAFLFATVLERFLGLYAPINSFVQTLAVCRQREGVLKRWPPRAGQRALL